MIVSQGFLLNFQNPDVHKNPLDEKVYRCTLEGRPVRRPGGSFNYEGPSFLSFAFPMKLSVSIVERASLRWTAIARFKSD